MKVDPNATPTARRIHKRGLQKKASFVSGHKFPGIMQCESMMEADFVQLALLDPRIVTIQSQPFCIEMITGEILPTKSAAIDYRRELRSKNPEQQTKIYTPDFLVEWRDGARTLFEIHHSGFLKHNDGTLEYPGILASQGLSLTILTEAFLWGPVAFNAHLLKRHVITNGRFQMSASLADAAQNPVSIQDLLTLHTISSSDIFAAIANGCLTTDLNTSRLDKQNLVQLSQGNNSYLHVVPK